jgi:DNA-binding GntR family transcriptional regulator
VSSGEMTAGRTGEQPAELAVAPEKRQVTAVEHVIEQLREFILTGRIAPGVHLQQEDLAVQLGVSRAPVREALKALSMEGLLLHSPNRGYFLRRLGASELHQTYLMRKLLETYLLETMEWPDEAELIELEAINERMASAGAQGGRTTMVTLNREFHFRIFAAANAPVILDEVRRLWDLSDAYRSIYLYSSESRERIVHEHRELISALRQQRLARCIEIMDAHRSAAELRVAEVLGASDYAVVPHRKPADL